VRSNSGIYIFKILLGLSYNFCIIKVDHAAMETNVDAMEKQIDFP